MKNILVTGAKGYIGTSFEKYMSQWPEEYRVEKISVVSNDWMRADFSKYDTVLHLAGIAHRRETKENAFMYYEINRDLTVDLAKKSKREGVKHFVFMGTMSIYGMEQGIITPSTQPKPNTHYGRSKLEAEQALAKLEDENFRIAVLRPPMVYGKDCKGNFQLMLGLVKKSPVFPVVKNQRSMISIGNLCSFLRMVIDNSDVGVFFPQNREYANTTEMAEIMTDVLGRRLFFSRLAGLAVSLLMHVSGMARKAFSTLIYQDCEKHDFRYCTETFVDSLRDSV